MSKKLQRWFRKNYQDYEDFNLAQDAWYECKKEILKILNNEIVYSMPDYRFGCNYIDKNDLINKIEKI